MFQLSLYPPGAGRGLRTGGARPRKLAFRETTRQLGYMRGGWTYIMTNKPRGVLYIGVTADLATRIHQHRHGAGSSFCQRYNLKRLVLAEPHDDIESAIRREKAIKEWRRAWKIKLIEEGNPRLARSVREDQRIGPRMRHDIPAFAGMTISLTPPPAASPA